ncbi:MAG: hypothetical protein U0T73_00975 [Chitinophagales bacterium]
MIKYSKAFQKKLEDIFDEGGYAVRYEKGNFNSGYCILEARRVVVINKFHSDEAKINSLIEILGLVDLDFSSLSADSKKLYEELKGAPVELFDHNNESA